MSSYPSVREHTAQQLRYFAYEPHQDETKLTRRTNINVLTKCEHLDEFIGNPEHFFSMAKRVIKTELAKVVVQGVEYEKFAGSIYELCELPKDSQNDADRFPDQLYKMQSHEITDFDSVLFDSEPKRNPRRSLIIPKALRCL